ncbi:MAG: hypothetical protein KAV70_03330 [Bacteroidales bacterium]|nr:hypothetical protein [Bacteroidales bacterium]
MKYKLLSDSDIKAIDALKEFHGGAAEINRTIKKMRNFETRKKILVEKGFGEMIADAGELIKKFPKVDDFTNEIKPQYNSNYGIATSQVSGFQGAYVTHHFMKKVAETAKTDPVFVPAEMISVVPLTDYYVYSGDLMATLAMTENIMQTSKYCSTNLIGIPHPESSFKKIEEVTGKTFDRADMGDGMSAIILKNQGTPFGNFGGIEVADDNHLFYLDGVIRTAKENGADFFLNPSWSSIIAACYFGRDIPNLTFKISMLLATQNTMQLRMLLNIINEYIRDDNTTPIYEINIGNGVSPHNFIQCAKELKESGIKGVSLAAHIRINPDLGIENFDWTENAYNVLENGTDMTFKYESDGTKRELDTMATYFMSDDERLANADKIGDVIYYKALRATNDGKDMIRKGIRVVFGKGSY